LPTEAEKNVTEPENIATHKHNVKLDDLTFRLIGIPFFGIFIPLTTSLFGNLTYRDLGYWLGYIYFITLAALIWQGNRFLLFRTRQRFTWFDRPIEKLILLVINNIFYTTPLTVAWLCLWYQFAGFPSSDWSVIKLVALINVICVLFVTHVYETVFMLREQQNEFIRNAELSQAKAEAELQALKNQIDPHFMFNSLNSLSYLISTDTEKAKLFTENLAEVYRYILSQKDHSMVMLEDELNFVFTYTELLQLRFGKALEIRNHISAEQSKGFLIPPISAFVALENAVKHNEISESSPLFVEISIDGESLIIQNKIQPKRSIQHSSKIGLKNLDGRFRIIVGKSISIQEENNIYAVNLPMITAPA
jgi:sensor histidine kinase YesM